MFRGFCFKHIWSCGFLFKEENPFKDIKELWKKIQYVDNLCKGIKTSKTSLLYTRISKSREEDFWREASVALLNPEHLGNNLTHSLDLKYDLAHPAISNQGLEDVFSGGWPLNKLWGFSLLCPVEKSQAMEARRSPPRTSGIVWSRALGKVLKTFSFNGSGLDLVKGWWEKIACVDSRTTLLLNPVEDLEKAGTE